MTVSKATGCLVLIALALGCRSAVASESLIELMTGGLDFNKASGSGLIVLEAETVAISPIRVVFKYRLSTPGPASARIDIGFHYPDLDFSDPDATYAIPGSDPVNFLDAKLRIAGAPAILALSQTASLDGKNLTEELVKAKLPLVPLGDFFSRLAAAPVALRKALEADGLLREAGTSAEGEPLLFPDWTVKTEGVFKLTIEAAKPVEIELVYKPSVGIRQDSLMRKALRENNDLAPDVAVQKSLFCSDPGFLKSLDTLTGADEANIAQVRELRMRILLRNPSVRPLPAVAYKLSVDKGKASRLASLCAQNLNRVSATTFVTKMSNFVPKPELNLLMIEGNAVAPPRSIVPTHQVAPFVGGNPAAR